MSGIQKEAARTPQLLSPNIGRLPETQLASASQMLVDSFKRSLPNSSEVTVIQSSTYHTSDGNIGHQVVRYLSDRWRAEVRTNATGETVKLHLNDGVSYIIHSPGVLRGDLDQDFFTVINHQDGDPLNDTARAIQQTNLGLLRIQRNQTAYRKAVEHSSWIPRFGINEAENVQPPVIETNLLENLLGAFSNLAQRVRLKLPSLPSYRTEEFQVSSQVD